jgi:hypothetical protein
MLQAPHHIGYRIISNIFILDVLLHSTRYLMKQIQEQIEMKKLQYFKSVYNICIIHLIKNKKFSILENV